MNERGSSPAGAYTPASSPITYRSINEEVHQMRWAKAAIWIYYTKRQWEVQGNLQTLC